MKLVWSRMSRSGSRSIFPVPSERGFQVSDHLHTESVVSFKSDVGRLQRVSISNEHGSSEVTFTLAFASIPSSTSMAPSIDYRTGSNADHQPINLFARPLPYPTISLSSSRFSSTYSLSGRMLMIWTPLRHPRILGVVYLLLVRFL
jgi:hypothetical protein